MKCRKCKKGNRRVTSKGKLKPDPKYPNDRKFDERKIVYTCDACGDKTESVECPNLLSDLFSD